MAKRVLIVGRGKSGEASANALAREGWNVDFVDNYQMVVMSPGVAVKSELQLGCEELKRRGWKLIAITGSKGKSSVVKLIAEALGGIPCGNYGVPVSSLIQEKPGWAVVEVSSFQLEATTLSPDTFEAAAILNLQEDHLDRHGSKAIYHALKLKLLTFAKKAFLPFSEKDFPSSDQQLFAGSYFYNAVLKANAMTAIAVMRETGLDDAAIVRAFAMFRPLPHRFEMVAERRGVKYIDDSKATSIAALGAGVKMGGENIWLIAGGLAKGDDPNMVNLLLTKRVKKVYLIGQSAEAFASAWRNCTECEVVGTMEKAVEKAKHEAVEGGLVLLSPGAASFDQFKNFEERGEVFARLANQEG